jgi:type VII secretion-associated serine protease mycosin
VIGRVLATAVATVLLLVDAPMTVQAADIDRWHLEFLRAAEANAVSQGEGVIVAVIDTGVDASHPDLAGSVVPGFNPDGVGAPDGRSDTNGHGTGMAGLIVGHGIMIGIAPKAKIMPIRASNTDSIARGIDWAVANGAQVINISKGHGAATPDVRTAVASAVAAGVVIVASAGNAPDSKDVEYPAAFEGVIAAAAVNRSGARATVSVGGDRLVLAAPGEQITTTGPGGIHYTGSGTSQASALIAGVAALVKARFPNLSGREIYHRLVMTADDKGPPGRDAEYGYGIVNPVRALTADVPPLVESPSPNADASPQSPHAQSTDGSGVGFAVFAVLGVVLAAALVLVVVLIYRRSNATDRSP